MKEMRDSMGLTPGNMAGAGTGGIHCDGDRICSIGQIEVENLGEILDIPMIRALMEDFHRLTRLGIGIVDSSGKILLEAGWQDVCTKFHRVNPETLKMCLKNDLRLADGIGKGEYTACQCDNRLWDMVTPVFIGEKHIANLFAGQFFYDDEEIDSEFFAQRATAFGFDGQDYAAALGKVPFIDRRQADAIMDFLVKCSSMISRLACNNFMLTRSIADHENSLDELKSSENRLRRYFEMSVVGIAIVSKNKKWVTVNDRLCAMLGCTREAITDIPWEKLTHPEDVESQNELFERVISGEIDNYTMEKRLIRDSGEVIWTQSSIACVRHLDGTIENMIELIQDITEQKNADLEKEILQKQLLQSQKMEAMGQLASGIAHDFNNMIGVILGYTTLAMTNTRPGEKLHSDLQMVMTAGVRTKDLIRQLLAFGRKQTLEEKVLNIAEVINGIGKMIRRLIPESIEIITNHAPGLGCVKADASQIEQIIMNIAVNARDAMPDGGKLLLETANVRFDDDYVRLHGDVKPGNYIEITISDTGTGMDSEVRKQIFNPFFTTKEAGKGTGLGLSTVFGIVKQHHGTITVYSEPGFGTTFKIYLPRVDEAIEHDNCETEVMVEGNGEIVLVVEDNEMMREVTRRLLESAGYIVLAAESPDAALAMYSDQSPLISLLLTDLVLPRMNGRELYQKFSELLPSLKVLFMSGYPAEVISHFDLIEPGIVFIQKPFTGKTLLCKVREALV